MTTDKNIEFYTKKQTYTAKQLIEILKTIPKEKQSLFVIIVIAYIDGLENGSRINEYDT